MTDSLERAPQAPAGADQDDLAAAFMAVWGNPEMSANPQPLHRELRSRGAALRMGPMVLLNTREAVHDALHRPTVFSSGMESARLGNTRPLIPMQIDPPDHGRYRRMLDPLFSPKQVAALEPALVRLVDRLIDGFVDRGSCDFTAEFAQPVPCLAFLRLLGLPDGDMAELVRMKDGIVHPPRHDVAETERVQAAAGQDMYRYFTAAVVEKERRPGDDLISRLLAVESDGKRLTRDEVVDICYLIVLAGLDTITDTLTLSYVYLARHPDQRHQIVADPGIIPAAVEELLRWESPIPGVPRIVVAESEIAGCPVKPGDVVYVGFGAANTDEEALPDAYEVRFDRHPNRHLAFGGGVHRCLGSHLARLEVRVAMREWHRRIPEYAIAEGAQLHYLPGLRAVEHLPLTFPPGGRARTGD